MARSPLKKRSGNAAEDIVRAAERLFGEDGVSLVSLRQIAIAANQVNNFAVQYHFGDKDGLIQAIFQRRLPFIENRRRLQMDEARKEGFTLYNLNEALFRPIVEEVDENGHRVYVRFLAQIVCDNRTAHHWLKASSMVPSIIEIMTEQAELCPHLSETDLSYRLQLVNAMMFQAIYLADQNEPEVPKFEAKFTSALRMAAAAISAP